MGNKPKKEMEGSSFFSRTPELSFANIRPESTKSNYDRFGEIDLKLGSNFKIHGGQRAHKIKPRDNIGLNFLGQDDQRLGKNNQRKVNLIIIFSIKHSEICFRDQDH